MTVKSRDFSTRKTAIVISSSRFGINPKSGVASDQTEVTPLLLMTKEFAKMIFAFANISLTYAIINGTMNMILIALIKRWRDSVWALVIIDYGSCLLIKI
jgi:hypothetical protein